MYLNFIMMYCFFLGGSKLQCFFLLVKFLKEYIQNNTVYYSVTHRNNINIKNKLK